MSFVGAGGGRLEGVLRRPDLPARGSVLMAHCFTCSKDLHTISRLARRLTRAGWVTMAFDFTGLGESGGSFSDSTVTTEVGDLGRAAVAMLERQAGPCLLLGHSLGGAAAVLAASRIHTLDGLVCVATPAEVAHVRRLFVDPEHGEIPSGTEPIPVTVGGRPFLIGRGFLSDLERHDVESAAAALEIPVLVVEAGADEIVGPDQTGRLARAAQAETAVVAGADHLFSGRDHARQLGDIVVEWATRHAPR